MTAMSGLEQAMSGLDGSVSGDGSVIGSGVTNEDRVAAATEDVLSQVTGPSQAEQANMQIQTEQMQAKMEAQMQATFCPLVGMTKCFDAYAECSHMLSDAMHHGMEH